MRNIITWFFLIAFISCSSFNWDTYTDEANNFSIQYPNEWIKEIRGNSSYFNNVDTMYYYEPPFGASSGIYIQFRDSNGVANRIIAYE